MNRLVGSADSPREPGASRFPELVRWASRTEPGLLHERAESSSTRFHPSGMACWMTKLYSATNKLKRGSAQLARLTQFKLSYTLISTPSSSSI